MNHWLSWGLVGGLALAAITVSLNGIRVLADAVERRIEHV